MNAYFEFDNTADNGRVRDCVHKPMTPEGMRQRAEQLIGTGQMPTLEELSAAVLETRNKYGKD